MPENPGQRTILVVDDEPAVRNLVAAMLTQQGFTALTADSGETALTIYRRYNQPIDLLVTDVIAPGMSGPMLADRMTALQPGLKVLFMSGYERSLVVQRYVIAAGHELLTKPFNAAQLEAKVASLFRAADAGVAAKA
jgi:two-component system cell cycle sensor histidine kinase/response regulator CckA